MKVIRTAEEMACALASPLDPTLLERLTTHRDNLLDYPGFAFEELGLYVIVEPGDKLNSIVAASPVPLVHDAAFVWAPETVDRHGAWLEVVFILSDDGFGLVLFVPLRTDTDASLLSACRTLAPDLKLPAGH